MPAKKHSFTVTEIKAGVMVVVSALALGVFIAIIQGLRPPEATNTFHVYVSDVAGLNKGADVRFGGTKVGRVTGIALDPKDRSRLRVVASVRKGVPINVESDAYIGQVTLMSEKHLEVTTGNKDAELLKDGAEIHFEVGGLFGQAAEMAESVQQTLDEVIDLLGVSEAKEKEAKGEGELVTLEMIFEGVRTTLDNVQEVIGEDGENVSVVVKNIEDIEKAAQELLEKLNGMLAENRENIQGITEGVNEAIRDAGPIIDNVAEVSEQFDEVASSLQEILNNAQVLTGEAQEFLRVNRPAIEDIILDLREMVRHLKAFSRTMAEQPQAVIRGKAPEGRKQEKP